MFSACSRIHGKVIRFSGTISEVLVGITNSLVCDQFGKAIVCSDTAAEAARYGFTAVDRPEGFLVLAVASLGEDVTELTTAPEVYNFILNSHVMLIESSLVLMCWIGSGMQRMRRN